MLGLIFKVAVGCRIFYVSHLQCAEGCDKNNSPTLYSYQVFVIHIYNVFQHQQLWLVVMIGLTVKVAVGDSLGFSLAMCCRL